MKYIICKDTVESNGKITEELTEHVGYKEQMIKKIQELEKSLPRMSGIWYHLVHQNGEDE